MSQQVISKNIKHLLTQMILIDFANKSTPSTFMKLHCLKALVRISFLNHHRFKAFILNPTI